MKAIVAVAASMLTAAFYILERGVAYQDLGKDYFDGRDRKKITLRLIKRLTDLGMNIENEGGKVPATAVPSS